MFTSRWGNYQVADEPWYKSEGGVANGVATLDGSGQVPTSQLPPALVGAVNYIGTWNASTNTPALASGGVGGDKGDYYVVSVAGSTNIDGITDWQVGDWIINNGTIWEKVDNTDAVFSVNGLTGAVSVTLNSVLNQGNTTSGVDVIFNEGDLIKLQYATFYNNINTLPLTSDRAINFPDKDGVVALLSDITTAVGNIALDDLTDVTTGLPVSPTNADDGRVVYFDIDTGQWISDDIANISNVVKDCKTTIGNTIPKGTAVYLSGYDNDLLVVEPCDNTDPNKMACIGITAEQLDDTNAKKVISFGKLQGVDTSLFVNGDVLYVGTGGGFTTTRPTGSVQIQQVAVVLKSDALGGQLKVYNTSRVAGLPNLTNGKIWVGNASGYPVEVDLPVNTDTNIYNSDGALPVGLREVTMPSGSALRFTDGTDYLFELQGGQRQAIFGNGTTTNEGLFRIDWGLNRVDFRKHLTNDIGLISWNNITANRTWNLPDATGTIALTSDIPADQNLSSVLGVGNTTGANDISINNGQGIVFNAGSGGTLKSVPTTANRSWDLPDANGVLVVGAGTADRSTRWVSSTQLGTGAFSDTGTRIALNDTPVTNNMITISGDGTSQFGALVTNIGGIQNTGIRTIAGGGVSATGLWAEVNASATESVAGFFKADQSNAGDNIGVRIIVANAGAGNHYGLQIQDGTQGAGKVLTSDANGFASWQNAGGGGSWSPPTIDLSAWLSNGASTLANANAGFQKSFSSTANDEILAELPLRNNEIDYDGSNLQLRLHSQLFVTAPSGADDVIWELDYVFLADGDDGDSKPATTIVLNVPVGTRTADQLYTDTIGIMNGLVGAHTLGLTLRRRSSGAGADSYPNDVDVFSVDIIK